MAALPVLSVAFDKVDKQDDCHALWQVFSRCKDAIDDGARLENLTWRLWNRNLTTAKRPLGDAPGHPHGAHFSLGVSDSELSGFTSDSSESASSAGADEAAISARSDGGQARRVDARRAQLSLSHPSPGSAVVRPVLEPRSRSSPDLHPGKFISELLPNKLVVPTSAVTVRSVAPASASAFAATAAPLPSSPRSPLLARPLLETVIMPSTPPSATTAGCPAVVVVNPTPHPTPPATPRVPDEVPHAPAVLPAMQPSVSSATLRVPGAVVPATGNTASGEHEADGRKAAPTMFFLCHEPNTPEHSPDSESSATGTGPMAAAAATAAAVAVTAVNAKPRDSPAPPPRPNSISTTAPSFDEASADMPGSATSSSFRPPSSIGSASRQRKGKEPVRHHVGTRAVGRPTFAHRASHHRPASRTVSPAKRPQLQAAPAPATQQPQEAPVTAPPPPVAVVPATGASNKPRADPVMPNPAVAPVAAPAAAREPSEAPPTRPINPQQARNSLFTGLLAPANRKVELATSSEFDSDTGDDSSWASEDESVDDGPDIAREAALEAQRQREMFAKLPTRSWSNLDRLPQAPGLLTSMFHPERAAQASASSQDILGAAARTTSAPSLQMVGRSPVAAPLIQQVTAQPTIANNYSRTGYRPRARPEDEPEDTDTDEDDPEDTVQVSQSVAQRRLAALAGRHSQQQRSQQQQQQQQQQQPQHQQEQPMLQQHPQQPQAGPSALPNGGAVAPIPFNHAYLPVPLPPQTPRTTRRNMLASEMSESLRRNLLWERQVAKRSHGLPRNTSAGSRVGGLQPMTSLAGANEPIDDREARRRAVLARNRSWADDFHTSGW
ncbi:hypothetical protein AURDEDRAFT_112432 [Auricularia subglabra TFB-10046 SS5]|nr:hypothetical protein AURDEDRAFT_112432 [Auricularia subglabra TFB-10046 SS5]